MSVKAEVLKDLLEEEQDIRSLIQFHIDRLNALTKEHKALRLLVKKLTKKQKK